MERQPRPVKLIAAVLFADAASFGDARDALQHLFSPVDFQSEPVPFDYTDYYRAEMGAPLQRVLLSFHRLVGPGTLASVKHASRDLEDRMAENGCRRVNIDTGYLDMFKLVLASFKGRGNKIYLERGVWADMTLYFTKRGFQTFPWTFPDFKSGLFHADLKRIREIYKAQLRGSGADPSAAEAKR